MFLLESKVQCPMSNVCLARLKVDSNPEPTLDLGHGTLDFASPPIPASSDVDNQITASSDAQLTKALQLFPTGRKVVRSRSHLATEFLRDGPQSNADDANCGTVL